MSTAIHWFRRDLRLTDNPALQHAATQADEVLLLYVHAPGEEAPWVPGAASRWWLDRSLAALQTELGEARLILRAGNSLDELLGLVRASGAELVTWNRLYEPALIARDRRIKAALTDAGCEVRSFRANLLLEPWEVATQAGQPYKVFTPFWRTARKQLASAGVLPPVHPAPARDLPSRELEQLALADGRPWTGKLERHWQPGAAAAMERLDQFIAESLGGYADDRNRPDRTGTSRLSPYLHFGELSPGQIWTALAQHEPTHNTESFAAELGWREFAHHLLYHFPQTPERNFNARFDDFPWRRPGGKDLRAWQRGETGIDFVDAAMRELWDTGWMHNRMRMLVGSLLTKNLGIHWQEGARWFWDTLVDADLANNTMGWQWIAGCGADAAPYFRIFNPQTQAEKFDPDGAYRKRWLAGRKRPQPIIDLGHSRREALDAYRAIRTPPAGSG